MADEPTADDVLEETRGTPNDHPNVGSNALPEDGSTPAAPDEQGGNTTEHPASDTDLDADEVYEEGVAEAANEPAKEQSDNSQKF